ncbi:MAG: DNA-binding protein WhiA [Eubacteriales bacterium]
MSFSSVAKNELSRLPINKECCAIAELSGILRLSGSIILSNSGFSLKARTSNAAVARRIFSLLKELFNISPEIEMHEVPIRTGHLYSIVINSDKARIVAEKTYLIDNEGAIRNDILSSSIIKKRCCKIAFLRGLFLGGGCVTTPEKMYHLEMVFSSEQLAKDVCKILNNFKFNARITRKKENFIVYIKEGNKVAEFMSFMGCHESRLKLENVRVIKEVKNNVNRAVNCETANLSKTLDAAFKQINSINYIKDTIGLEALPPPLLEVAMLRISSPPDTRLEDLGKMLNKQIGKSGVNHRLNKINEIADNIKSERKK